MQKEPNYNYLDLLNEQQRAAVIYDAGPSLVIAGAGSGKTRVLTYKIVDLLAHGYEPYRILALTFTNKAAREMKSRVADVVGESIAGRLWMGTFHSVFLRILRRHADLLGYKPGFTIYDAADSKSLVKSIIKEMDLDDKLYKPNVISATISNAKNALISASQYSQDTEARNRDKYAQRPMTSEIYHRYVRRCKMADAMDFDDILFNMNVLLRDNPELRHHYQEFFRYILVDEYQDTNFAQHMIISQLAGENPKLCVVGDDAQSIYSFRGANISNILNLEKRYAGLKVFKLERNYRSSQNIVNASSSLIAHNKGQLKKNVYSENSVGEKIKVLQAYSDLEEGYMVATAISNQKLTCHDSFDDYAVLYRTNAQSRVLEESLRKRNIPYRIYGGLSFYQRKEVRDAVAYFRMAINPDDDEALRRIINYPARGIGETTVKKIQSAATENNVSMWSVASAPDRYSLNVNAGTKRKLAEFSELMRLFINANNDGVDAETLGNLIYQKTAILSSLQHDQTPEAISRQQNLKELQAALKDFVNLRREEGEENLSMSEFISQISLATDQDVKEEVQEPKVTLMTAHAAKGLEFKHIYIVGVEEELFPSSMAAGSDEEVEEERRLLYVAITRAKETCTITFATSRYRNGQNMSTRWSRFIKEIDRKYLDIQTSIKDDSPMERFINPLSCYHVERYNSANSRFGYRSPVSVNPVPTSSRQSNLKRINLSGEEKPATSSNLIAGMNVRHSKFGEGSVERVYEQSGNLVALINFKNFGEKKLLLKYAKLDILS